MGDYRIVIDQGTSGTKAILFETEQFIEKIDRIDIGHKQIFPEKGWVEHDPNEIMSNIKTLIDDLIESNDLSHKDIKSLSIANQRESVLVWDRNKGEPISNIMVWQCNRGIDICENLKERGYENLVKKKTGLTLDPYFSGSKLKHFLNNNELSELQMENLAIGTVDTWIIWNLTNGNKFLTDISNASRTLLFNIIDKKWDQELTNLFNVPMEALPKVVSSVADYGEYKGIPIVSCMADSQAALAGHLGVEYGNMKATLGTGSSVLMNIGEDIETTNESILTTIGWEKDGHTVYAAEGLIRSFGDILSWERHSLELFTDFEEASYLAFSVEENGGVYFIPALEGLGAPFWAPEMKALFFGMTRDTKKEHLLRASFEAMAFQIRAVVDEFKKQYDNDLDHPLTEILVDGGASRNTKFMQMLADITKMDIVINKTEELSALGTLTILGERVDFTENTLLIQPQNNFDDNYTFWKTMTNKFIEIN